LGAAICARPWLRSGGCARGSRCTDYQFPRACAVAIDQPKAHFEDVPLPRVEQGQNVLELLFEHAFAGSFSRVLGALSSMKSPTLTSPSSPTGASSETGWRAILSNPLMRETGRRISSARSSAVGSRPSSWLSCFCARQSRVMISIMWTGMRMVRAWSAMGAGQRLTNPPHRISGKLIAAPILELLHALDQAKIALLNQIEQRLPPVGVFSSRWRQRGADWLRPCRFWPDGRGRQRGATGRKCRKIPPGAGARIVQEPGACLVLLEGGSLAAAFGMFSQLLNPP